MAEVRKGQIWLAHPDKNRKGELYPRREVRVELVGAERVTAVNLKTGHQTYTSRSTFHRRYSLLKDA